MTNDTPVPETFARQCGFVALIGIPNAGKSTLLNALVGTKVSIVSHKVQTTRALIRGIVMHEASQVIFVDTPGLFAPKRRLDRAMVTAAWSGAGDADHVALLVDARKGLDEGTEAILAKLKDVKQPKTLILTKLDLVEVESLLALSQKINEAAHFDHTFMVSATNKSGIKHLVAHFAKVVPKGPWLYPEDEVSDLPMRNLASEITREKMLHRLHDELPYEMTVETESYEEKKDGSVRIAQTIFVTRDGHKKIVLGKGGETIKTISMESRKELSAILECPVHLFLFVKVREKWADDPERYQAMGLELPRGE